MALPSNPDLLTASASEAAETARDERYLEAAALYGAPLERMARAYEADPSRRQDLLQEMQSLHAYRTALERRRDHYASAWRWSLWPVIPGVIVILGGGWLFDERPGKWLRLSLAAVVCALAFVIGLTISLRKSAGFQRELDAVKTLGEDAS